MDQSSKTDQNSKVGMIVISYRLSRLIFRCINSVLPTLNGLTNGVKAIPLPTFRCRSQ